MNTRALLSACGLACLCFGALSAEANAYDNRWFRDVSQDGRDVSFKLQLIEGDTPSFDTTFKLVRGDEVLFEDRQFVREEADEVDGPGCIDIVFSEMVDCDDDGTAECEGVCGTAYRYEVVDECVPEDDATYWLYDEATLDENGDPPGEYVGYYYPVYLESGDASCLDSDGCSVAGAPGRATEGGLAALMLLVGLGFVVVARRRKNR